MLHKRHQCNELDGNTNPSSGVFWPQLVIGLWPKTSISKSPKCNWNKQQQILVSVITISDFGPSPACAQGSRRNASRAVSSVSGWSFRVRLPESQCRPAHRQATPQRMQEYAGITNPQVSRSVPAVADGVVHGQWRQTSLGHKGHQKMPSSCSYFSRGQRRKRA